MSNRILTAAQFLIQRKITIHPLLAFVMLAGGPAVHAQEEIPQVISPLRVETDLNGVNLIDGRTQMQVPVLSVPTVTRLSTSTHQRRRP